MESIIILTYDCNFRCTYCDIDKRKEKMSQEVFEQTMTFFQNLQIPVEKMKFFGGEPLLEEQKIRQTVTWLWEKIWWYFVTTNASILNNSFLEFSQANNVHITVSLDGDKETTEENRQTLSGKSLYDLSVSHTVEYAKSLRVNQVITSKNAYKMYENFLYLYNLWFRKFNFLPEYYREWSKAGLRELILNIQKIKLYIIEYPITLINAENYSPTSFFNFGIVVDTDGTIYGTNLILSREFEKYKPFLKIGDVEHGIQRNIFEWESEKNYLKSVNTYVGEVYSQDIRRSVEYVDAIISEFVIHYAKQR